MKRSNERDKHNLISIERERERRGSSCSSIFQSFHPPPRIIRLDNLNLNPEFVVLVSFAVPLQILEWESSQSIVRAASFFSSRKMLKGGELNSVQCWTNSLKEEVRQRMLNQELVFMKHVSELHRLYRMQVAITEDLKHKDFNNNILHKGGVNSMSVNMSQNNREKCSVAEYIQTDNFNLKHKWCRLPAFSQKPLDLQLPADEFISYCVNDFSGAGDHRGYFQHSVGSKSSQGETVLGLDNFRLSLGIVHDHVKKDGQHTTWMGMKTSNVIDLEDPELCYSDNHGSPGLVSCFDIYLKGKLKIENLQQTGTRNGSYGTPSSISVLDIGPSSYGQASCVSGQYSGKHKESSMFSSNINQESAIICSSGNNLDLNVVQQPEPEPEETSNNPSMLLNSSPSSFSNGSIKVSSNSTILPFTTRRSEANVSYCPEMRRTTDMDLNLAAKYEEKDEGKSCNAAANSKVSFIGVNSLCSSKTDTKISWNVNFSACDESMKDRKTSNSSESKIQEPKLDEAIKTAALLIVQISLEAMELGLQEENRCQCSSESYEALVLKAKECEVSNDYLCVSSNAYSANISEKEENKYKLKRGTRMKEFQKDILPGLSTLSRQEIREYINIMDSVIRSREYRKMRATISDEDYEWSGPRKGKRPRVSYSRRYCN